MAAHLIDNEIFISDAHKVFPNRKIIKKTTNTTPTESRTQTMR